MYDPQTVAHEIRSPIRGKPSQFWPKGYRSSLVTIWHVDPERNKFGHHGDDTCGWFSPPFSKQQADEIRKLGQGQFWQLFRKREQMAKGDPEGYAHICYEPSCYDAIYWAWRAIKNLDTKHVWQYGRSRSYLTAAELEEIFSLSSNPMDNFRTTIDHLDSEEKCGDFFLSVYRNYRRFYRPWYQHPRWHVHHWKFQIHHWQQFRRWLLTRCAECGGKFRYGESPVSLQWDRSKTKFLCGETGLYHDKCCPPLGRHANG